MRPVFVEEILGQFFEAHSFGFRTQKRAYTNFSFALLQQPLAIQTTLRLAAFSEAFPTPVILHPPDPASSVEHSHSSPCTSGDRLLHTNSCWIWLAIELSRDLVLSQRASGDCL